MAQSSTTLAAVIGFPVRHSLSPVIHNAAFAAAGLDWTFVAFEVAPGDTTAALEAMRVLGIAGLSVTMPHKEATAAAVDKLSPVAAELGAANCVALSDGRLIGHNTDGDGFCDAVAESHGFHPAGRRCVVLGAGGAGLSVALALAQKDAAAVDIVNRTPSRAQMVVDIVNRNCAGAAGAPVASLVEAAQVGDYDLVVNATPQGMAGSGEEGRLPLDPNLLHSQQLVVDTIYNPPVTPLLAACEQNGVPCSNGLGLLIGQAARSFAIWTGETAPTDAMWSAARAALQTT